MSELPFGWNDRQNGANIHLPDAPPAGDWRAHNLGQKYAMSVSDNTKKQDPGLPFGWGDRNNTKTLEELSLSMDSTNVAVAEVNLAELERAKEQKLREAEAAKHREKSDVEAEKTDSSGVVAALQPQLNALRDMVRDMDTRLQSVEENVAAISKQQELIINLLMTSKGA
mmetsp:Transcript_65/g.125  ORF Transcript_65/g.125 Transcript_65/m.125 type:complete len:169 (+) Transcript_65:80-586(+)